MQSEIQVASTEKIISLHNEIIGRLAQCVEKAIKIGELLLAQKEALPHGSWLPWIKENLPFTDRTARNYIALFENRAKLETVSDLSSAYRLLAAPVQKEEEDSTALMEEALECFKQATVLMQEELKDDRLPIEYWAQVKTICEKMFQQASEYSLGAKRKLGECLINDTRLET